VGLSLIELIEKILLRNIQKAEIEDLFGHLDLIAPALAFAGVLILVSYVFEKRSSPLSSSGSSGLGAREAALIGAIQGLSLPFRGFSRSTWPNRR